MTDKITLELTLDELKLIDKYFELNDETESVFDKINDAYPQPKMTFAQSGEFTVVSYNYKLYCRFEYSNSGNVSWYRTQDVPKGYVTGVLEPVTDAETERLLEGLYYNHIEVKKETAQERGERVHNEMEEVVRESVEWCEENQDKDPLDWLTPKTPEETEESLKEAFREAVKQGVVSSSTKSKTLTDLIYRWWSDVFTTHSDWDMETSIEDLVDRIELFLPKEQSAEGSQNAYVESAVEGFNDCLTQIKGKLR